MRKEKKVVEYVREENLLTLVELPEFKKCLYGNVHFDYTDPENIEITFSKLLSNRLKKLVGYDVLVEMRVDVL